jgi:L-fucose mutarotase
MLKNVSPIISPDLVKILCEMGHGDEIVLADSNFPGKSASNGHKFVRADDIGMIALLEAILPLFPLDTYDKENFLVMQVVDGDPIPEIWNDFKNILSTYEPDCQITYIERFAYYERARNAYSVVATGETAPYANVILKKGIV